MSDGQIAALLIFVAIASAVIIFVGPQFTDYLNTHGSLTTYLCGIAGAALLMVPFIFSIGKRSGALTSPPLWFTNHVIFSMCGFLLVAVHSGGRLTKPPALLFLLVALILVQGVWMRIYLTKRMSEVFATKLQAFRAGPRPSKVTLREIINSKIDLLLRLDARANEATFSPQLHHWVKHPILTWRYARLAANERSFVRVTKTVPTSVAFSRRVHILLAILFLIGLILHIGMATFFSTYISDGKPAHWPHISSLTSPVNG